MSIIEIIFGILILLAFILGVIGVIIEKIRSGEWEKEEFCHAYGFSGDETPNTEPDWLMVINKN